MKMNITILPGDGIGPEITEEAKKILQAAAGRFDLEITTTEELVGGASIDKYGKPLDEEVLQRIKKSDAVLLGSVGGPKWDHLTGAMKPESGLLQLRQALDVYANLRPVFIFPSLIHQSPVKAELLQDVDLMIIRELTSGIYFGKPRGRIYGNTAAFETNKYYVHEIERLAHFAFQTAQKRKKHVTSIDKANVLETSRLWRETMTSVANEYPDVALDHLYIDNAAMQIIKKPAFFDVIAADNMFGDILSDEASVLAGSIGLLPSASIAKQPPFLYEPIHGSAPKYAGLHKVNPIGTILSVAMMMRYSFKREDVAGCIEAAVRQTVEDGIRTYDIADMAENAVTTIQMGDIIAGHIKHFSS